MSPLGGAHEYSAPQYLRLLGLGVYACASSWPHVPADTPIGSGVDPALFGSTTRTDGTEQLTIDGQPLYFFAGDQEPGDLLGQGLNDVWFAVGGDGVANEAKAGQSPLDGDDGYDY